MTHHRWHFIFVLVVVSLTLAGCFPAQVETWDQITSPRYRTAKAAPAALATPHWDAGKDDYPFTPGYEKNQGAQVGEGFDLAMRNPDFPAVHIAEIHVDLTSPNHWVRVVWSDAKEEGSIAKPTGPWRSSPGQGLPECNCDDVETSNTTDTHCTPKGVFVAKGFSDHLLTVPECLYATWVIHKPRFIALHSSGDIPTIPASGGCIRLPHEAAKLIHNNSLAGVTLIRIDGRWKAGPNSKRGAVSASPSK